MYGESYAGMYLGSSAEGDVTFVTEDDLVAIGLPRINLDNTDGYHTRGDGIADGDATHGTDLDIP